MLSLVSAKLTHSRHPLKKNFLFEFEKLRQYSGWEAITSALAFGPARLTTPLLQPLFAIRKIVSVIYGLQAGVSSACRGKDNIPLLQTHRRLVSKFIKTQINVWKIPLRWLKYKVFKHGVNGTSRDRVNRASSACVACPDGSPLLEFHTRQIDGIECGLFSIHAPLGQTTLRVGWVSVQCTGGSWGSDDCMCNCLCSVIVLCEMMMNGREKVKPGATLSLLFSKSTKGATRLNVPIRWTNRYQQYYMPSQHTYCGRVWNLIQACDVQSSD